MYYDNILLRDINYTLWYKNQGEPPPAEKHLKEIQIPSRP